METKHKNALIGALLAVVFVMAVGYAAFAQQLTINGSASISSNWDVHISDITGEETSSSTGTTGSTDAGTPTHTTTTAEFNAKLVSPGDQITYTVTVENGGNIDAELTDITLSVGPEEGSLTEQTSLTAANNPADPIVYTVEGISEGETLAASDTKQFTVKVVYNSSVEAQPATTQQKAKLVLMYNQAE